LKQVFKNSIALLLPAEKRRLFFLILTDVLISLLDIAALALLLALINFYSSTHPVHLPLFFQHFAGRDTIWLLIIFFAAFSVKNICGYLLHNAQYKFVYAVASRLSEDNMRQYFNASYQDHVSIDSAVHIKQVSQQPVEFAHYVLAGIQQIITQVLLIGITITAVLLYNAVLFILLPVILLPPVIAAMYVIRKKTIAARKHAKTSGEKALQYLKEGLNGYIESAMYGKKDFFINRYVARQRQLNNYLADLQAVHGLPSRLLEIFAVLGLFVLIIISKYGGDSSAIPVLTIGAFMAAAYKIMPGIIKILNSTGQIKTYAFTVTDLLKRRPPAPDDMEDESPVVTSVSLRNIGFSYDVKQVLDNFSCNIQQGEFVGLSGISGSGKTTIINLLCGFIDPSKGDILINGIIADKASRLQLRKRTAYVKQYPFLIHGSLQQNIALDYTIDNEQQSAVITAAGLNTLNNKQTANDDILVTENGRNISGGQRQRIAIARALYKDADLIILDEPFNELDNVSEHLLLQHFKSLAAQGKIVLLVTHNRESLSFCDRVIDIHEA